MKKKWLKNLLINLSLVALSPFIFFGMAELTVAMLMPQKEWTEPPRLFRRSEQLGGLHLAMPNYNGKTFKPDFGAISIRTNSLGLREHREYDVKRRGVFRILALGDSFTWGTGVAYDKTYLRRLEKTLNNDERPERVEIVKAGIPAYQTPDALALLKHMGLALEPDMVLLGFIAEDMIDKDTRNRNIGGGKKSGNKGLILEIFTASSLLKAERKLRNASHFYKLMARYLSQGPLLKWFVSKKTADSFLLKDYPPKWQALWSATEGYLQDMQQLLRDKNIPFVIVVMPQRLQIAMRQLQLEGNRFDAAKPAKLVQAFGEAQGVPVLDLMPHFLDAARNQQLFFPVDGHPNAAGTALIASALDTFMRQQPALQKHLASGMAPISDK